MMAQGREDLPNSTNLRNRRAPQDQNQKKSHQLQQQAKSMPPSQAQISRDQFEQYVKQIFRNLRAKDSGNALLDLGQDTFLQFGVSSQMTSIIAMKRLFLYMAWLPQFQQISKHGNPVPGQSHPNGLLNNNQNVIRENPQAMQQAAHPCFPENFKFLVDDSSLRCSETSFIKTFSTLYFGSEEDLTGLIFSLLCVQHSGGSRGNRGAEGEMDIVQSDQSEELRNGPGSQFRIVKRDMSNFLLYLFQVIASTEVELLYLFQGIQCLGSPKEASLLWHTQLFDQWIKIIEAKNAQALLDQSVIQEEESKENLVSDESSCYIDIKTKLIGLLVETVFGKDSPEDKSLSFTEFTSLFSQSGQGQAMKIENYQNFKSLSVITEYLKLTLPFCSQFELLTQNGALINQNILRDKSVPRDESCDLKIPKSFLAASNHYVSRISHHQQQRFSRSPQVRNEKSQGREDASAGNDLRCRDQSDNNQGETPGGAGRQPDTSSAFQIRNTIQKIAGQSDRISDAAQRLNSKIQRLFPESRDVSPLSKKQAVESKPLPHYQKSKFSIAAQLKFNLNGGGNIGSEQRALPIQQNNVIASAQQALENAPRQVENHNLGIDQEARLDSISSSSFSSQQNLNEQALLPMLGGGDVLVNRFKKSGKSVQVAHPREKYFASNEESKNGACAVRKIFSNKSRHKMQLAICEELNIKEHIQRPHVLRITKNLHRLAGKDASEDEEEGIDNDDLSEGSCPRLVFNNEVHSKNLASDAKLHNQSFLTIKSRMKAVLGQRVIIQNSDDHNEEEKDAVKKNAGQDQGGRGRKRLAAQKDLLNSNDVKVVRDQSCFNGSDDRSQQNERQQPQQPSNNGRKLVRPGLTQLQVAGNRFSNISQFKLERNQGPEEVNKEQDGPAQERHQPHFPLCLDSNQAASREGGGGGNNQVQASDDIQIKGGQKSQLAVNALKELRKARGPNCFGFNMNPHQLQQKPYPKGYSQDRREERSINHPPGTITNNIEESKIPPMTNQGSQQNQIDDRVESNNRGDFILRNTRRILNEQKGKSSFGIVNKTQNYRNQVKIVNLKYFQAYQKAITARDTIFKNNENRNKNLAAGKMGQNPTLQGVTGSRNKRWRAYVNFQGQGLNGESKRVVCFLSVRGPDLFVDCAPQLYGNQTKQHQFMINMPDCIAYLKEEDLNLYQNQFTQRPMQGGAMAGSGFPGCKTLTLNIMLNSLHKRVYYLDQMYKVEEAEELISLLAIASEYWNLSEVYRVKDNRFKVEADARGNLCILGQGSFGKVYKALDTMEEKDNIVAVKQISKHRMPLEDYLQTKEEIEIMRVLTEQSAPSSKIIRIRLAFEDQESVFIVMDYFQGQTLFQWVLEEHDVRAGQDLMQDARKIFKQLAESVKSFHALGMIHQDLKLENILISEAPSGTAQHLDTRIIDFGLSTVLLQGFYSKSKIGTVAFMPPEVLFRREHNQQMDLWALGVILCALVTSHVPFVSLLAQELTIRNICYLDVNFSAQCWEGVPLPAIDLITGMLQKDPYKRITIEQVLKHPWLHSPEASQNIEDL